MISILDPDVTIISILSADSGLVSAMTNGFLFYNSAVPQDTLFPYILLTTLDARGIDANGKSFVAMWSHVKIECITKNAGLINTKNLFMLVNTLLLNSIGSTVSGSFVTKFVCEYQTKKTWNISNDEYASIGGVYTSLVSES